MPKQISNESENLKIFRFAQNNQRKPWQRNKQLSASQKLVKSCWLIVLPAAQRVMWIMCECKLFENPQPTDSSAPQRGAWVETWHNWGTLTPHSAAIPLIFDLRSPISKYHRGWQAEEWVSLANFRRIPRSWIS